MQPWVDPDSFGSVLKLADEETWQSFTREYAGGLPPRPFDQVVATVRAGGCRTVVVEHRYVDVDYRSEYSNFWSLKFDARSAFTRRLHFFSEDLDEEKLHLLDEGCGYLGYAVIRPVEYGRGRTDAAEGAT